MTGRRRTHKRIRTGREHSFPEDWEEEEEYEKEKLVNRGKGLNLGEYEGTTAAGEKLRMKVKEEESYEWRKNER